MEFRKFLIIMAIFLVAGLSVQPVLSATTMTSDDLRNDTATILYNNAELLVVRGDYGNAIDLFDRALMANTTMLKKTDAILYLYRDKGYAQIQLEKYNDAIATLDAGLALYPKDPLLWNNKGYALSRLGKMQDALGAYDSALSFDRNYTIAHINRGDALSKAGRYGEAVAAYTRANETDPGNKAAADGITTARNAETESTRTITIVLVVALIAVIGIAIWYVRFRKPAEPAPEETKTKSKKK